MTATAPGLRPRVTAVIAVVLGIALAVAGVAVLERPLSSPKEPAVVAGGDTYLTAVPTTRAAIGSVALDGSLAAVVARLGPPDAVGPDVDSTAHEWALDGGASLSVSAVADAIVGVVATVPHTSSVRLGLYGGLRLGEASVADVVAAWGAPEATGGPDDDFDVRYVECRGPSPVVLKVWSAPTFDRVLVAYADEPPGANGCGGAAALS